jgi:serine/threonine protein kinase
LKPSNILLTNSATGEQLVKLCDFGIAQHPPTPAGEYEGIASTTTDSGVLRGTPRFMAPEQLIRSGRTVPATDQWACALVAFRCLAGHDYFGTARNGVELVLDIVHESLVAPSELEPRLTKAFDAWFLKSCCRDPFERFSSVDAQFLGLREALGDVVMRPIARSRPAAGRNSPAHTDSVPVSLSRSADALNRDGHFWRDAAFGTMALVAFAISVLGTKLQSGALRSRAQASHLRSDGSAAQQAHLPPFAPSLRASSSPASAPALVPPFQTLPTPQDPSATAAPRSAGPAVPAKNEGRAGRPHSQSRLPRGAMCSRSTQCIDGLCLAETCQ